MTEQQIHIAVVSHLRMRANEGVFFFHCPNGGKRSWSEGKAFKQMGVVAGVPDLIILKAGECFCLELKAMGGRVQPSQRLAHAAMQEAGATTAIARGLEEALITLETWGIIRRDMARANNRGGARL
jgi:hypothetical protein